MFQFTARRLLLAVGISALVIAGFNAVDHSIVGRSRYSQRLREQIAALHSRCPADVPARVWQEAVDWTLNLHGNSLVAFQCTRAEILHFDHRLEVRLAGPVDLATIDWIWAQYAELCRGGREYQRFQQIRDANIAAIRKDLRAEREKSTESNRKVQLPSR